MKKQFIILLVIILTLSFNLTGYAETDGDYEYQIINNDEAKITKYLGEEKEITIPDKLGGCKVIEIGEIAFWGKGLNSVVIPDGVKIINRSAFRLNSLVEINIPDTVEEIGETAFYDNDLERVKLSKNLKTIRKEAFLMNFIKEVILPEGIEVVEVGAFANNDIRYVEIPKSLKRLEVRVFFNNELEYVVLHENIQTIDDTAFYDNNIHSVAIYSKDVDIKYGAFGNSGIIKEKMPITFYSYNNSSTEEHVNSVNKDGNFEFTFKEISEFVEPTLSGEPLVKETLAGEVEDTKDNTEEDNIKVNEEELEDDSKENKENNEKKVGFFTKIINAIKNFFSKLFKK